MSHGISQKAQLPPELLQEIFLSVCHDANTFRESAAEWTTARTSTPNYHSPASPYSISHVNRQWRNVAINFPQLWTHLRIVEPRTEGISRLAMDWIDRAKSRSLHLSLHTRMGSSFAAKPILRFYIGLIPQCVSFELDLHTIVDLVGIRWPDRHALKLARIRIRNQFFNPDEWEFLPNFFLRSSTLSSLVWNIPQFSRCITKISQPCANLTHLAFRLSHGMGNWTSIPSKCTNLMMLMLSIDSTWYPAGTTTITLSQLTFLSVHAESNYDVASAIFNCLTVPLLLELEIITSSLIRTASIVGMLKKSEATLEKLRLTLGGSLAPANDSTFAWALASGCLQGLRELEGRSQSSWTATRSLLNDTLLVKNGESASVPVDAVEPGGASRSMCRYLPYLDKITLIEYEH